MTRINRRVLSLAALLLCIVLVFAGCSGSGSRTTAEQYARTAWQATGRTDAPASVFVMQYTSPDALTNGRELPDSMVCAIPENGYAFVFAPRSGGSFAGLQIVFMTTGGNVLSRADYDTLYTSYATLIDTTQQALHLSACNYLAYLYMDAWDAKTDITTDAKTNQWYSLNNKMIETIMKK